MDNTPAEQSPQDLDQIPLDTPIQEFSPSDIVHTEEKPAETIKEEEPEEVKHPESSENVVFYEDWYKVMDPKTNKPYYYNKKTRETTWLNPMEYSNSVSKDQSIQVDDSLIWFETVDPKTKQYYYFNKLTRETSWKMPEHCIIIRSDMPAVTEETKESLMLHIKHTSMNEVALTRSIEEKRLETIHSIKNSVLTTPPTDTETGPKSSSPAPRPEPPTLKKDNNSEKTISPLEEDKSKKAISTEESDGNAFEDDDKYVQHHQLSKQFLFRTYAKKMFNLHRRGFFKTLAPLERILSWKRQPIKQSLLILNSKLSKQAVKLNKLYKSFIDPKTSLPRQYELLQQIITILIRHPPDLTDEAYCQLIKELTKCPKSHLLNCWKLFSVLAGCVTPNEELFPYIQYFVSKSVTNDVDLAKYCNYVFHTLHKNLYLGKREEIPTIAELSATLSLEMINIRVYLVNDTFMTFQCDPCTSVEDLTQKIVKKLKLGDDGSLFGLYESINANYERLLSPKQRILDVVSRWQAQYLYDPMDYTTHLSKFVYKTVLYVDTNPDIPYSTYLCYLQCVYDLLNNHYSCSNEDYYVLAALLLQAKLGDFEDLEMIDDDLLNDVLPYPLIKDDTTLLQSKQYVFSLYQRLKGYTLEEAVFTFMDYIKSWDSYGYYYFYLESTNNVNLPTNLYLAVGPRGITFGDPETSTPLKFVPYSAIPSWGYNKQAFIMHIGSLIQQEKYIFSTIQGQDINNLMNSYVQYLVNNKTRSSLF